jgi:hypothetical protein
VLWVGWAWQVLGFCIMRRFPVGCFVQSSHSCNTGEGASCWSSVLTVPCNLLPNWCRFYLPPHPRAGQQEVLIDKLPGTPDGVSRAHDGSFWVSLIADIPGFTKWFGLPVVRGVLGHIPGGRMVRTQQQQLQRGRRHRHKGGGTGYMYCLCRY